MDNDDDSSCRLLDSFDRLPQRSRPRWPICPKEFRFLHAGPDRRCMDPSERLEPLRDTGATGATAASSRLFREGSLIVPVRGCSRSSRLPGQV